MLRCGLVMVFFVAELAISGRGAVAAGKNNPSFFIITSQISCATRATKITSIPLMTLLNYNISSFSSSRLQASLVVITKVTQRAHWHPFKRWRFYIISKTLGFFRSRKAAKVFHFTAVKMNFI